MNADKVVEKILAEAKSEAAKIKAEADAKMAEAKKATDEKLGAYKAESERLGREVFDDKKSRLLAAARMSAAKAELGVKREVLDEVFESARAKIRGLGDVDYKELVKKLMKKAVETGEEEVVVGKDEKRIDESLIKEVAAGLKMSSEKCNTSAGFILKRGDVRTNVTVEVLLEQAREELETELFKELFG